MAQGADGFLKKSVRRRGPAKQTRARDFLSTGFAWVRADARTSDARGRAGGQPDVRRLAVRPGVAACRVSQSAASAARVRPRRAPGRARGAARRPVSHGYKKKRARRAPRAQPLRNSRAARAVRARLWRADLRTAQVGQSQPRALRDARNASCKRLHSALRARGFCRAALQALPPNSARE